MTLASSHVRAIMATMTLVGGSQVVAPMVSHAAPALGGVAPSAASCAEECNRRASDCLDSCEERFKNDDKARVTCKFECANKRQQCERECG